MATPSQKAAMRRHIAQLLEMDWVTRHEVFMYNIYHGARLQLWGLIRDAMSPSDLLGGTSTGRAPEPVIALPDRIRRPGGGAEPVARRRRRV
jgi:hypothetical protein